MENNVSLCISAIFLFDSFHYCPLYCTVIPCFISNISISKICCTLLYVVFQMLGMCRGRQDQQSTVMKCVREGSAVLVQLSIRKVMHHFLVLHLLLFNCFGYSFTASLQVCASKLKLNERL